MIDSLVFPTSIISCCIACQICIPFVVIFVSISATAFQLQINIFDNLQGVFQIYYHGISIEASVTTTEIYTQKGTPSK